MSRRKWRVANQQLVRWPDFNFAWTLSLLIMWGHPGGCFIKSTKPLWEGGFANSFGGRYTPRESPFPQRDMSLHLFGEALFSKTFGERNILLFYKKRISLPPKVFVDPFRKGDLNETASRPATKQRSLNNISAVPIDSVKVYPFNNVPT